MILRSWDVRGVGACCNNIPDNLNDRKSKSPSRIPGQHSTHWVIEVVGVVAGAFDDEEVVLRPGK
jgi:anti-sigma factor ChrR (cupin superfamily)